MNRFKLICIIAVFVFVHIGQQANATIITQTDDVFHGANTAFTQFDSTTETLFAVNASYDGWSATFDVDLQNTSSTAVSGSLDGRVTVMLLLEPGDLHGVTSFSVDYFLEANQTSTFQVSVECIAVIGPPNDCNNGAGLGTNDFIGTGTVDFTFDVLSYGFQVSPVPANINWILPATVDPTIHFAMATMNLTYEIRPKPTISVPEPSTFALFGIGLAGIGVMTRRRRKQSDSASVSSVPK